MVLIKNLFREGKISRISELELNRYINFFENSYKDNLNHSKENLTKFPRWSIISGYYAMHDIAKLFIAKKFRIKIRKEVHSTTIKVLRVLSKRKDLPRLLEIGYKEFKDLIIELEIARKERIKVQYYTGTTYLEKVYQNRAKYFLENIVVKFITKMERLIK
jgi:UDP-N-acetylglucosamine:LPS N-acetylglucosamine transferase